MNTRSKTRSKTRDTFTSILVRSNIKPEPVACKKTRVARQPKQTKQPRRTPKATRQIRPTGKQSVQRVENKLAEWKCDLDRSLSTSFPVNEDLSAMNAFQLCDWIESAERHSVESSNNSDKTLEIHFAIGRGVQALFERSTVSWKEYTDEMLPWILTTPIGAYLRFWRTLGKFVLMRKLTVPFHELNAISKLVLLFLTNNKEEGCFWQDMPRSLLPSPTLTTSEVEKYKMLKQVYLGKLKRNNHRYRQMHGVTSNAQPRNCYYKLLNTKRDRYDWFCEEATRKPSNQKTGCE